ncbi:hypothetical protein [uncultured Erythrobacter sp.]|uniref:hypothetical protein n=1 Tax=uncultured Erythrobacter sp. TaxID=263913 RepID=UPI002603EF06|nr:hypothetical protein [uncultured Erythrobacter sp.]
MPADIVLGSRFWFCIQIDLTGRPAIRPATFYQRPTDCSFTSTCNAIDDRLSCTGEGPALAVAGQH